MSEIRDKVLYSKEPFTLDPGQERIVFKLLDLIQAELRETGDRDWILDCTTEESVRISHILGRSIKVASGLTRLGFKPGDTLHTAYSTCLDFYWPIFGAWLCGGVVSVGDPGLSTSNLRSQIQDTHSKIIVCEAERCSKFLEANQSLPSAEQASNILVLDLEPWQAIPKGASSFRSLYEDQGDQCPDRASLPGYNPKEPVVMHWTSGTTGSPKGVVMSQEYMHFQMRQSKLPEKTIGLATNIFFHAGSFLLSLDGGIRNKFYIYLMQPKHITVESIFSYIEKYKPMFFMCGANDFVQLAASDLAKYDLSSVNVIMPAGNKIAKSAATRMKEKFSNLKFVYQFYGSTEVGGVSGSFTVENMGALREGVQAYIRDQKTGEKLGVGEVGEIMAKTPTMMIHYLNRPDESRELLDGEGFAHMGDLGFYDENGILHYKERIKEMIKIGNYWIGPVELEDNLENIPGVVEAVVWQSLNKETDNYYIHGAVTLQASSGLNPEKILELANKDVEVKRRIDGTIHIIDNMPHNPQGKKLRRTVRQIFE